MRIVVEGPDGSGKSHLVSILEDCYGQEAHHDGGPPKTLEELWKRVWESPKKYAIMDRWSAISELVYGEVLRGEPAIPRCDLLKAIDSFSPIIFYCRPPNEVLFKNRKSLFVEKSHKTPEHCKEVFNRYWTIVAAYDNLMDELIKRGHPVLIYDYTGVTTK